jgi:16S rRNA (guanine527-N7)-methyltransferase
VETDTIAQLLHPYIQLEESRLRSISTYVDLLVKWNARINLTAVRVPEEMVQRHFGESLFAAKYVLSQGPVDKVIDVGSGAGFPGVPFAMLAADARVTLIESNQKKATFLRELIRVLDLKNASVFSDRAEKYTQTAAVVTMRAVEGFERTLPRALDLVETGGRIALMVGASQVTVAQTVVANVDWLAPTAVPGGHSRVLFVGSKGR